MACRRRARAALVLSALTLSTGAACSTEAAPLAGGTQTLAPVAGLPYAVIAEPAGGCPGFTVRTRVEDAGPGGMVLPTGGTVAFTCLGAEADAGTLDEAVRTMVSEEGEAAVGGVRGRPVRVLSAYGDAYRVDTTLVDTEMEVVEWVTERADALFVVSYVRAPGEAEDHRAVEEMLASWQWGG